MSQVIGNLARGDKVSAWSLHTGWLEGTYDQKVNRNGFEMHVVNFRNESIVTGYYSISNLDNTRYR